MDPKNQLKLFEYYSGGRLKKKTLPDNVIEMSYDATGRLEQVGDNISEVRYTYQNGQLKTSKSSGRGNLIAYPGITLTYDYDENGNRKELQDSYGGIYRRSYDDADRLTEIVNPKGERFTYTYSDAAAELVLARPGSQTTIAADPTGFVKKILHQAEGVTLASFDYQRDFLGNRIEVAASTGTRTYGYDDNSQLLSVLNAPELPSPYGSESFSYDSIGNRTTDQRGDYTYDSKGQRLDEDYLYRYYYDENGNLKSKQKKEVFPYGEVTNYSYSSSNQLIGFKVYESGNLRREANYAYDVLGRRIQKHVIDHDATSDPARTYTRWYAYDGDEILLELDNANVLARYTHSGLSSDDVLAVDITQAGSDAKLAKNAGGYQYLKDVQGTISEIADSSGRKIQRYLYSAFGMLLGIQDALAADVSVDPPVATTYGYTGREFDRESGLMYYRARYYDPAMGRFLQKDAYPGQLRLPASVVNSYSYTMNNPANLTDPTGMFSFFEKVMIGIGAGIAAVLVVATLPVTAGILGGILVGGAVGAATGFALGVGINLAVGRPAFDRIGEAVLIGAAVGALAGGATMALRGASFLPKLGSATRSFGCTLAMGSALKLGIRVLNGVLNTSQGGGASLNANEEDELWDLQLQQREQLYGPPGNASPVDPWNQEGANAC